MGWSRATGQIACACNSESGRRRDEQGRHDHRPPEIHHRPRVDAERRATGDGLRLPAVELLQRFRRGGPRPAARRHQPDLHRRERHPRRISPRGGGAGRRGRRRGGRAGLPRRHRPHLGRRLRPPATRSALRPSKGAAPPPTGRARDDPGAPAAPPTDPTMLSDPCCKNVSSSRRGAVSAGAPIGWFIATAATARMVRSRRCTRSRPAAASARRRTR